jgi:chromosome segregation ATPase
MSEKLTMGIWIRRILGICLMIFSTLGLAISLFGLPAVSRVSKRLTKSTDDALALTLTALDTTSQSLSLVHDALGEARDALDAAQTVVEGVDDGLQNTGAMIDSLGDTLTDDLSQVIWNTQDSVAAAGEGAALIEDVLYDLNAVSLLIGVAYEPDVSLTESFANINKSLDGVPQTLAEIDEGLSATQESLHSMQTGFTDLTDVLGESKTTLTEAQANVDDYSSLVEELSLQISSLQKHWPRWIRTATLSLYFLLMWVAISQIGLLWQGWEMVSYHPAQIEERVRELEEKVETVLQKE